MPWCPKCKNEYREGITVCADCNVPLVEDFSTAIAADKTLVFNTEHKDKIDAFIKLLDGYEILELARTGIAGLGRGIENVTYLE